MDSLSEKDRKILKMRLERYTQEEIAEELGCESIKRMTVEDMPCTVAIDAHGGNLFLTEREKYKKD